MDPRRRALPRTTGFSQADGGAETGSGAKRRRAGAFEGPERQVHRDAPPLLRTRPPETHAAAPAGFMSLRERGAGPHLEWVAATGVRAHRREWADTDGTGGREGERRHPASHASEPLNPVQRPNPGPLPAQARLARSSEPILIPKLRI